MTRPCKCHIKFKIYEVDVRMKRALLNTDWWKESLLERFSRIRDYLTRAWENVSQLRPRIHRKKGT